MLPELSSFISSISVFIRSNNNLRKRSCFSSNEYLLFLPIRKEFVEDKIETFYSEWKNPTGDNLTCLIAYNF